MTKKTSLLLLSGIMSLGALAATSCGIGGIDPYNIDFSTETSGTTISFWTPFGGAIEEYVDNLCAKFKEETGITVKAESKGGYDNLNKAINLAASSKKYPEVALAYPDHMASYVNSDIIVRMDYYFENDGDDTFKKDDFYSDYLAEGQTVEFDENGNGYTLGLPFNKSTEVLCYNKEFFEWAGAADSEIKIPTTWSEAWTVCQHILAFMEPYYGKLIGKDHKAYDTNAKLMAAGTDILFNFSTVTAENFYPFTYDSEANLFITAARQIGGSYTTFDKTTKKGYLDFKSDKLATFLDSLKDASKKHYFAVSSTFGGTTNYNSSYFTNCQSVLTVGSSAGVANSVAKSFTTGVAPILFQDAAKKFVISQGTDAVLLNTGTMAQRVAAWKFIKYLTKEANGYFAANTSYFPSCEYATNSKDYQDKVAETKDSDAHGDIVWYETNKVNDDFYLKDSEKWTKFTDPAFMGSSAIREELSTSISQLFINYDSGSALIDALYTKLSEYVKK